MAKIFITGGAGFIGSHTVDACLQAGHDVTVYDIKPWSKAVNLEKHGNAFTYIEGHILDNSHLEKSMEGHTHVLHLAAVVSVPRTIEDPLGTHAVNVTGTLNVFECARLVGSKRVVYASSAAVYGNQTVLPITEDSVLLPESPYGAHKAMNDMYARIYNDSYQQSILGLRYFNVFGTRQDPHSPYSGVISIFSERVKSKKPITMYGDGSATRDFISVRDVARANLSALMSSEVGVCNIASGTETSLNELVRTLEVIYERDVECLHEPVRKGDITRSCGSGARARTLLDFSAHDTLEDGLRTIHAD